MNMSSKQAWLPRSIAATVVAAVLGAVLSLSGCALLEPSVHQQGLDLMDQGQAVEGLARLEEAVRQNPKHAEYRITLALRRASAIQQALTQGQRALDDGRLTEAEEAFRTVLRIDPEHTMARQGQAAIIQERRHRLALTEVEALIKKGTPADLQQAHDKLRPVLSENPGNRLAQTLRGRVNDELAKLPRPGQRLAATFQKPITLEFRDAPLKSVFDVISKVSGLNFFFDREIRPDLKATILARNTSIEDAIRLLLVTNQLEQKVLSDNAVLIYPNTPAKLKDYQPLTLRSFYLANADVKAVSNSIKTLLKTKDMVVDERLGIIMLRDTPDVIRMAERIVALQDLRDPEVMLEVEVMEVKRSRLLELGIQWPSQLGLAPLKGSSGAVTLADLNNLSGSTIQATLGSTLINARKEDQNGNILANPRIRVRNKEKAKVLIGDRVPVITTTSTSTGFVSESVNYVDVGIKLDVEPNIYLDDEVAIKVNLEVSSLVREVLSKSGSLSYQIGTRGANTVLRLKDGETQVLAGLISDEERSTANKVPLLGEMPILGRLFGSQKDDTQRTEILLSITPRVVRSLRRPDLMQAEFESGTEGSIGADPLLLRTVEPPAAGASGAAPAATPGGTSPADKPAAVTPASGAVPVISPAAAPVAATSALTSSPASGAVTLSWQAPAQVKAGEQFTAVLRVQSGAALTGLPALVAFDPQALQVVSVQEGDFLKQAGAQTQFSQRVDAAQGKVFAAGVRQGGNGPVSGINGVGSILSITFKALKAPAGGAPARVQLLSLTPEPPLAAALKLPVEHAVRIAP
ncbi:MAG: general secretion pathway protein GspD [Burkholderiales bacterium]|nr:general secretion pathway protein GspD [Burkholderiales bacterium]